MALLNLASYVEVTEAEGPGKRFALWVQGCLIRCPGCINPHMFELTPRHVIDCEELFPNIDNSVAKHGIEGVTFLGGEPFLQAKGLSDLAKKCRAIGLSVMVFTGYTWEELHTHPMPLAGELLEATDILVDGPYLQEQPEEQRNWVGSRNQNFYYLTDFYPPGLEWEKPSDSIELRVSASQIKMTGWPARIETTPPRLPI